MVETIIKIVSQTVLFVVVLGIGVEALLCDARNPLPKFDDGDGDENRSITIVKTRSIIYKEL